MKSKPIIKGKKPNPFCLVCGELNKGKMYYCSKACARKVKDSQ